MPTPSAVSTLPLHRVHLPEESDAADESAARSETLPASVANYSSPLYDKVHEEVCARTWAVRHPPEALVINVVEGNDCYVCLQVVMEGDFPMISVPHVTLSYKTRFESFSQLYRFKVQARTILGGNPTSHACLWKYGKGYNWLVCESCELHAVCLCVQELLPGPKDEVPFHITWRRSDWKNLPL